MATRFDFDTSYPSTAVQLERANLTLGDYPTSWFDYANWYSAVSPNQSIATRGGVDVFAVTMVQGQTYELDIDLAQLNLEIDILDQAGRRVASADGANFDAFLEWTATRTGQYYVAIRHADNEYTGNFNWQRDTLQTGDYKFTFAASPSSTYMPGANRTWSLSDASNNNYFYDTADEVRGNGGSDTLQLRGGNDIALGGAGADRLFGELGMDDLAGDSGNDRLFGGDGDDVLRGGLDNDVLYGGNGRDGLLGGSGGDILFGESSNDILSGEGGNDVLRGGAGVDILLGGAGVDYFRFVNGESNASSVNTTAYLDSIQDFSRAQGDKIDLRGAYGTDTTGILDWIGSSSFTAAYQVRASSANVQAGYLEVQVNLDGDAAAEMEILVRAGLGESDFLL